MFNNQKGFTLIELMVVVVIIGILAAIALPNFLSMQDRAKESEVKANVHTLQLVVEDAKTQNNGTKPTGFTITAANVTSVTALIPATFKNPIVNPAVTGVNAITVTAAGALPLPATAIGTPVAGGVTQGQVGYDVGAAGNPYVIAGAGKTNSSGVTNFVAVTTEGL